jgi:hypothetical protein
MMPARNRYDDYVLVSRRHGQPHLVTQPDHAALAGDLASGWGNDRFRAADRSDSLLIAARRHDDGWREIDGRPAVCEPRGRPAHFLEVPLPETIGPYGDGVARIYEVDPYAGVLASRHWSGLYSSRWGVQDSPPVDHPAAREVVAAQEQRAAAQARLLWNGDGLRSRFEAGLWHAYEILQTVDLLSLALCLLDLDTPTDDGEPPQPVPATLRGLDQPPGARLVPNVPAAGGGHETLHVEVLEPAVVSLSPWPLKERTVQLQFRARVLDDGIHPDPAAAYHEADVITRRFTLTGLRAIDKVHT